MPGQALPGLKYEQAVLSYVRHAPDFMPAG